MPWQQLGPGTPPGPLWDTATDPWGQTGQSQTLGMSSHQGCSMGLPWHRHRSCFPVYGSCKHQDLQLCPRPGPPVQADPWDTDPAQVTALIPPTATDTNRTQTHKQLLQALSCGHHNQCCQEMSTVPGSAAVWVPFMGQAASRALRKPQCCPRAIRNTLALRNPHCRIPATPEQHNCCLPVAAPALPPQQS